MKLKITISLELYCNIQLESNDYPNIKKCAKELIKELSKIEGSHLIDSYVESYLIPLVYDYHNIGKFTKEIVTIGDLF